MSASHPAQYVAQFLKYNNLLLLENGPQEYFLRYSVANNGLPSDSRFGLPTLMLHRIRVVEKTVHAR